MSYSKKSISLSVEDLAAMRHKALWMGLTAEGQSNDYVTESIAIVRKYCPDYQSPDLNKLRDTAINIFVTASTGHGDNYFLERAWLKAAEAFQDEIEFVFPFDEFIRPNPSAL